MFSQQGPSLWEVGLLPLPISEFMSVNDCCMWGACLPMWQVYEMWVWYLNREDPQSSRWQPTPVVFLPWESRRESHSPQGAKHWTWLKRRSRHASQALVVRANTVRCLSCTAFSPGIQLLISECVFLKCEGSWQSYICTAVCICRSVSFSLLFSFPSHLLICNITNEMDIYQWNFVRKLEN